MPWKDVNAMELRVQFISDWLKKTHTVIDLCALYGISRKSGYKWIDRYLKEGPDWRKCTVYRQTVLGGLPLALRLNEGLGRIASAPSLQISWPCDSSIYARSQSFGRSC